MADKRATIRLALNTQGYLASLTAAEKKTEASAKKMADAFDRAGASYAKYEERVLASAAKIQNAFNNVKLGTGNRGGVVASLREMETKGVSSAKKLERALQDLERAQKSLERTKARETALNRRNEIRDLRTATSKNNAKTKFIGSLGTGVMEGFGGGGMAAAVAGGPAGVAIGAATAAASVAKAGLSKFAEVVGEGLSLYDKANRISISARGAGQEYVDPRSIVKDIFAVTQDVKGTTSDDAADAISKFVSLTGDLDTARKNLSVFATVASASGASIGDVAETAASIASQFQVTDPKQVKDILAALTYQGKAGSFELKDAAALYQRLASSGAAFGLTKDAKGVKTLGGLTQIARSGTGSGEQAATAIESLFSALNAKSGKLASQGVKIFDGGKTRNINDIIVDAITKLGGTNIASKKEKLTSIFGEQGIRALNPLINTYQSTRESTAGTDAQKTAAATDALRRQLEAATNAAGNWTDIESDAQQAQKSVGAVYTATSERVKEAVSKDLVPRLVEFAADLADTPGAFDSLITVVEFTADVFMGMASVLESLGLVKGKSFEQKANEYEQKKYEREAKKYDAELKKLGFTDDQVIDARFKDPSKRTENEKKAMDLMVKRDAAQGVADQLKDEIRVMDATRKGQALTGVGSFAAGAAQAMPAPTVAQKILSNTYNPQMGVGMTDPLDNLVPEVDTGPRNVTISQTVDVNVKNASDFAPRGREIL